MAGAELVTLFGGELPEVSSARIGVRVAGGAKVSARDLAGTLLAMSIAELHGQGTAKLEEEEVKRMFRATRALTVWSSGAGEGLAGAISQAVQEKTPVTRVARAVFGGLVATPELTLISMAQAFLEPTGAVVGKTGLKRLGAKLGSLRYEIDDRAAEALRGQWPPVRARWESWKAANPALVDPLVTACRKSLGEARDTSSAGAMDFG